MSWIKSTAGLVWSKAIAHKFIAFIIIVAVVGGGYYEYKHLTAGTVTTQYVTSAAEKGTLVVSVSGSGQVSASNQTNIQAQVSGIVSSVPVTDNQKVKAGQILVILDTTNDERAVRNAQSSLENAQLALQTLLQPPSTSTLLQSQQSVVQSQQSLQNGQNSLASDYTSAYADVSNVFIDLSGVMAGLNNVLYSTSINKIQANVDAYTNLIADINANATQYHDSAISGYQAAYAAYNQALADYKNSSINSSTSTIESLLSETYGTLKIVSTANSNVKNLLDLVNTTLQQQGNLKIPAQLNVDETSMQSYISTTNNHLQTILQIQNSIQSDKQAITIGQISVKQTAAALEQLQSGPTQLQIQTQKLSVTQAQNALSDAKENLNNDYVRAPFDGIITDITARVGQPASGTLAVLVSNAQLAQATLNEVDVVNVKVGQQATVTFDALPDMTLTGKVSEVDTIGTVVQGVVSYNVQVALDVSNDQVRPGMSDTLAIITNVKQDVLLVPNAAISTKSDASYVQVLGADGLPTQVEVTTGLANDTQTEILSGINEGDKVVTRTITSTATTPTTQSSGGLGGIRIPGIGR